MTALVNRLSIHIKHTGQLVVVELAGDLDTNTSAQLRRTLTDLVMAGSHHLVIDLNRLDFLDSTELGALVGGLKKTRAQEGSLQLVCTNAHFLKVLNIMGLTKVFAIHESQDIVGTLATAP